MNKWQEFYVLCSVLYYSVFPPTSFKVQQRKKKTFQFSFHERNLIGISGVNLFLNRKSHTLSHTKEYQKNLKPLNQNKEAAASVVIATAAAN